MQMRSLAVATLALIAAQPLAARAVPQITPLPGPQTPTVTVTAPTQQNELPGGATQIWDVTYKFNNLEYVIPTGGGGGEFTLSGFSNVSCSSVTGAFGYPNVTCYFSPMDPGYYQLSNTGSIDNIQFTIPAPASFGWFPPAVLGLAWAVRRRRHAAVA